MDIVKGLGSNGRVALYEVADTELAVGSTLGAPKVMTIIKANGAIEKVYSIETGETLLGTFILRHYDASNGMYLDQEQQGTFVIHPEHQEHVYGLAGRIAVRENIFVLNARPEKDGTLGPPAVYQVLELHNDNSHPIDLVTYAYAVLRGFTDPDIVAEYDKELGALLAWNESKPDLVRIVGCSDKPSAYETSLDYAKAVTDRRPRPLSCSTDARGDTLGILEHVHHLEPGKTARFWYLISFGKGKDDARNNYAACPDADSALQRTQDYYQDYLTRSVVLTPDNSVNSGVIWAKANMLRVESKAPTGWCFVNDPTRSNNSVARDTAWFTFGADYVDPAFAREALLAYVDRQEKDGMFVEYYDIRTGESEDYGLNINDDTPLLIMALWHHYNTTGDVDFLKKIYPAAAKAGHYMLSQRNSQGLIWCTASGTGTSGIVGWRNVIPNYRLSGATTEVNSECYSALVTVSHMARVLEKHDDSGYFAEEAEKLKVAINIHLRNPENGLYYLNIDLDGHPRSDVTSDLVFPVMFSVADEKTSAAIIRRLSGQDFWTPGGIRTTPRDSPMYTPNGGWGLLGGVWVAVSFWYAFAAAKYERVFMAQALSTTYRNYQTDPRRNNTVPGQFCEWLNGETLVNEGMMLSPWFPPRYLWSALEGVAGLAIEEGNVIVTPRLAPDWKWMAVQNLPFRDRSLTWLAVRAPDIRLYASFTSPTTTTTMATYETDITEHVQTTGESICKIGLQQGDNLVLFAGNTEERTTTTSLKVDCPLQGRYRVRTYSSLLGRWLEEDRLLPGDELGRGLIVTLERRGFALLELTQEI